MLKVTTQGGEVKEVRFVAGMSVKTAMNVAEIKPGKKATITVNGKDARPKSRVKDGDIIVVTPKISNG